MIQSLALFGTEPYNILLLVVEFFISVIHVQKTVPYLERFTVLVIHVKEKKRTIVVILCLPKDEAFIVSAHSDIPSSLHSPTMTCKWYFSKHKISTVILEQVRTRQGITISSMLMWLNILLSIWTVVSSMTARSFYLLQG